jgi:hypothetical protein
VAVALACGGRAAEAGRLLAALCRAAGADAVTALADTVETGELLAAGAGRRAGPLAGAWTCFGRLRAVHRVDDPLLRATFAAVDESSQEGMDEPPAAVLPLLEAMVAAAAGREAPLLRCALEWRREHGGPATEWLYYQIAGGLALDARRAYRAVVEPEIDDIVRYEVECDLRRGRPEAARTLLGAWAEHLRGHPGEPGRVVAAGVAWLWTRAGEGARPALARDILGWDELGALIDARWEEALVRSAFADLHLRRADATELDLLSRYADHPALPPDARTVLEIRMATTEGTLDPRSIGRIRQRLAGLPAGEYRREVTPLLARFVSPQVPVAQYANAIRAAYTREHDAAFWVAHWGALGAVVSALPAPGIAARLSFGLGRSSEADAAAEALGAWLVAFLEFWFDQALPLVVDHGYLGPRFFLSLPGALDDLQRARAWRPVARVVERRAGGAPWYPFVEKWFIPRPGSSPATASQENRHG